MRTVKKLLLCILTIVFLVSCNKDTHVANTDRMLMVDDVLYYGTDEVGPMGDSEAVGGRILTTVSVGETPTQNGQSNFGYVGSPYTYDDGIGFIQVLVDDHWYVFYPEAS